jgi:hypothetical protein
MAYEINKYTGKFDKVGEGATDLDQIPIGDSDTYFRWVAPDTLELVVNGSVAQKWVMAPPVAVSGSPIGVLLSITNP